MNHSTVGSVVDLDIEAARQANEELMLLPMGMRTAARRSRHVIEIEHALDGERDVFVALHESQVAPGIRDLGQFEYFAVVKAELDHACLP